MSKKLDVMQALQVVDKITVHGVKQGHGYSLDGLHATPSYDGYTVTLSDKVVDLNIYFHNTFTFEYKTSKQLGEFMLKLERVASTDYDDSPR